MNQCCRTSCCASFHSGHPDQVVPFVLGLGPSWRGGPTSPAALQRPLRCSALRPPLFHHLSQFTGRGHRCQPPPGLHGSGCRSWQSVSPQQTTGFAQMRSCSNQAGLTSLLAPPRDGPKIVFLPGKEVFAHPRPAAPSQDPQKRYPSRQQAPPQRLDL
jgi:hypothetical protein